MVAESGLSPYEPDSALIAATVVAQDLKTTFWATLFVAPRR
jgi:hypothetical protein